MRGFLPWSYLAAADAGTGADFPGSLFRVLPSYGRVYVSTNFFCFRSSSPLTRTRVREIFEPYNHC